MRDTLQKKLSLESLNVIFLNGIIFLNNLYYVDQIDDLGRKTYKLERREYFLNTIFVVKV
jgi:hypothetical protein